MRATRLLVTATVLLSGVLTGVPAAPAEAAGPGPDERAAPGLEVTGFAYGDLGRRSLLRDVPALTTLTVDGVGLTESGRSTVAPDGDMVRLGRFARRHGLRTELLVHNYNGELEDFDPRRAHRLLSDPGAIDAVVRRLTRLVARGGWDGVNVDLELVRRRDAAGLVALCRALQEALPARRTVSVDVSASTSLRGYRDGGYRLRPLARAVDRVELMTYSQHGPTWSGPGPIGALGWQRDSVRTLLARVPAGKVHLGFGGYGFTWPPDGSGRTGRTVSPRQARALAADAGVAPRWHPRAGEWSARLPDGTVVWWSDARSYRERVALARDLGVAGLAVWELGSADPLRA